MSDLSKSPGHFDETHERWLGETNRDLSEAEKPDEWVWNQCESCQYWIPLSGVFSTDWGACSNSKSASDGVVRFAHDGCDQFSQK
ncbi:DUF3027 domain-containing protein [Rhizobacter sp. OV335]|uniref:DUF3027 domain-containing protein n=1 Tax=Rhizobacter sp. OV335 TaxID=1500264 RepID=UPI0009359247